MWQERSAASSLTGMGTTVQTADGEQTLFYDRLVHWLSAVNSSSPTSLSQRACLRCRHLPRRDQAPEHLELLPSLPDSPGKITVVVVGAGLTGIETAAEMPSRLHHDVGKGRYRSRPCRVILADRRPVVGSDMGDSARPVIEKALAAAWAWRHFWESEVVSIDPSGLALASGELLPAATIVWCAGMPALPSPVCSPSSATD